jgi:hypothetical protein
MNDISRAYQEVLLGWKHNIEEVNRGLKHNIEEVTKALELPPRQQYQRFLKNIMSSSPMTPTHSRHRSNIDISYSSSYGSPTNARRYSMASDRTPTTPLQLSVNGVDLSGMDIHGDEAPTRNGLGNLADELAEAWDDEEADDEPDVNFQQGPSNGDGPRDSGIDVSEFPAIIGKMVHLAPKTNPKSHRRKQSEYDGSDYGEDSDTDASGLTPGLIARMTEIESLVRRGTENNGTDRDTVVQRMVDGLRDLGSQSSVEMGATRLITAHNSLASHLIHQTRVLQSLTYTITSPLSPPPDLETIHDLLPLLAAASESLPRPATSAYNSLADLHFLTRDLVASMTHLSDTLYMSRQITTTAARRLKNVKEIVADMRKEEEAREEGERWLTRGKWNERLEARECSRTCYEVVTGFEEVCNTWRARLVAQAESIRT